MTDVIRLSTLRPQLKIIARNEIAVIMWARKVFDDIYELSLCWNSKEYQLWYARAKQEGGFELICCSMYDSVESLAIQLKELEMKNKEENNDTTRES